MVVIILPKTWIYVYIYIHTYEYAYIMFFQLYCYVLVKHLNRTLYKLSSCTKNFKLKLPDPEISLVEIYAKNIIRQIHTIVYTGVLIVKLI